MSVEQQIVDNVISTVAGATGVVNSQAWMQRTNALDAVPAVITRNMGKQRQTENAGEEDWTLKLRLHVFVDHDPVAVSGSTDKLLTDLVTAVHNALYADRSRGGVAVDTHHIQDMAADSARSGEFGIKVIFVEVDYKHAQGAA